MIKTNKILVFLGMLLVLTSLASAVNWQGHPQNCPSEYNFVTCPGTDLQCGIDGGVAPYCYDMSSLNPPASNTSSSTDYAGGVDGGYVVDCESTDAGSPYCDNTGALWCDRASSCFSDNRLTNCTASVWSNETTPFVCAECISGYYYCDGSYIDGDGCEVQNGASCGSGTGTYDGGCSGAVGNCSSATNLDCDNSDADGNPETCNAGNGCEITPSEACTIYGSLLPGTCSGCGSTGYDGSANNCSCTAGKSDFETGTFAQYLVNLGSGAMLWFKNLGTGPTINATDANGTSFIVNSSGVYWNDTALGAGGSGGSAGNWSSSGNDLYYSAGNVAVGLSSPNERLTVNGTISLGTPSVPTGTSGYVKLYSKETPGNDANTVLLSHFDGDLYDNSSGGATHTFTTINGANYTFSDYKFGTGSLTLDGTNQELRVASHANFQFTNISFTIDAWFNTDGTGAPQTILYHGANADPNNLWYLEVTAANQLRFVFRNASIDVIDISGGTVVPGTWQHATVERNGNVWAVFLDGDLINTATNVTAMPIYANFLEVGSRVLSGTGNYFNGTIDELRISRTSRYNATNFLNQLVSYGSLAPYALGDEGTELALARLTEEDDSVTWLTIGNDIYFNTGDVGVGTSAPTEALTVVGNITVNQFYKGDGKKISNAGVRRIVNQTNHSFGVGNVLYYNGTQYLKAIANNSFTLGNAIVSEDISNDSFELTMSGYIDGLSGLTAGTYYFTSDLQEGNLSTSEGSSYSNPILYAFSTTTGMVLPWRASGVSNVSWYQNSNDLYYNNGNIGIGTATPSVILEVEGAAYFNAKVGIGVNPASPRLYVKGASASNLTYTVNVTNQSAYVLCFDSSCTFTSNLTVGDNLVINDSLSRRITAITSDTNFTVDSIFVSNDTNVSTTLYPTQLKVDNSSGSNIMTVSYSGNIGIGTTSPTNLLSVDGSGMMQLEANTSTMVCNAANAGAIYYDGTANKHKGCNTTAWYELY